MTHEPVDPPRWADRPNGSTVEDRIGAFLRKVGAPELPDDLALERVRQRLMARPTRSWPTLRLVVAAAALGLAFAGAAVSAQMGWFPFAGPRPATIDKVGAPAGAGQGEAAASAAVPAPASAARSGLAAPLPSRVPWQRRSLSRGPTASWR